MYSLHIFAINWQNDEKRDGRTLFKVTEVNYIKMKYGASLLQVLSSSKQFQTKSILIDVKNYHEYQLPFIANHLNLLI